MSTGFKVRVIVIISMCIIIPITIGFYLAGSGSSGSGGGGSGGYDGFDDYDDYDGYDGSDGHVRILSISAMIEVDSQATTINVTMTHNGGDPIPWGDYQVTVGGAALVGNPTNPVTGASTTTTSVGESAMWTMSNAAGTFVVGDQYTIKVIHIEDQSIAWQKDITAIAA